MFVHNSLKTRVCDIERFCSELHFEGSATFVDELNIIVVAVYHSPAGDPNIFLDTLDSLLLFLCKWKDYSIVVGGDINYKFDITTNNRFACTFQNILRQYNFFCLNHNPTRGKNCLDNVFINNRHVLRHVSCSIIDFPYSDHNGILVDLRKVLKHKNEPLNNVNNYKIVLPKKSLDSIVTALASYDWDNFMTQHKQCDATQFFRIFSLLLL